MRKKRGVREKIKNLTTDLKTRIKNSDVCFVGCCLQLL
jgi:hypothetical protein